MKGLLFLFLAIGMGLGTTATASEYVESRVATGLVPSPVEYSLLAPANYRKMKSLPLALYLHGGGGSRDALKRLQPLVGRWRGVKRCGWGRQGRCFTKCR